MKAILTLVCLLMANVIFCQQRDKLLHASAGYVSASFTTAMLHHYDIKHPVWIGIGVGTCFGVGKELYDKYSGRGTVDAMDAVYTIGGSILGSLTIKYSIDYRKKDKPISDF